MQVNRVDVGDQTMIDLTEDTVTPETLLEGATAHNAAGEKITGYLRVCNQNLLDNAYFADPVNQRGKKIWTSASASENNVDPNTVYDFFRGYTVDRWLAHDTALTGVRVENVAGEYISITGNQINFYQRFEALNNVKGKTITFSALVYGNVRLILGVNGTYPFGSDTSNGLSLLSLTHELPSDLNSLILFIRTMSNSVHKIYAAKLEMGTKQTLAHKEGDIWVLNDTPPNKSLELLKCQRYYQIFATESLRPTLAADFRPVMRCNPALSTIEIDGTTYYTADANL